MSDEMNLELSDVLDQKAIERADDAARKADITCHDENRKRRKFSHYRGILRNYEKSKSEFEFFHSVLIKCLKELHEAGLIPNEHQ